MRKKSSREVYRNRWMTLREDVVVLNNGEEGIYSVVEKDDFVVVIPVDADGSVWLVEQLRYPVGERFWEFPQGGCEHGNSLSDAARRELAEETGLWADNVHQLGTIFEAYGYANQRMHIFLATGLNQTGKQDLDPEEGELIYRRFSLLEFEEKMRACEIQDAPTFAAYALWRLSEHYPGRET